MLQRATLRQPSPKSLQSVNCWKQLTWVYGQTTVRMLLTIALDAIFTLLKERKRHGLVLWFPEGESWKLNTKWLERGTRKGTSLTSSIRGRSRLFTSSPNFWINIHYPSAEALPSPHKPLLPAWGSGGKPHWDSSLLEHVTPQHLPSTPSLPSSPTPRPPPGPPRPPARRPAPPARTHTLRLLSALGAPALQPPQMKGPGSASALGKERATAAASSATTTAPAAPRRGTAAVWAGSTRFFVLGVLRSALPPPVRHLTENSRRRPAPDVPRPSQGLPGSSRPGPSMLHLRRGSPGSSEGGAGGGAGALRQVCRRAGLRKSVTWGGVTRPLTSPGRAPGKGGVALGQPPSAPRPAILGFPSGYRWPVTASLRHWSCFMIFFFVSAYVWSRSFDWIRLLGKITNQGKPLKPLCCIRFVTPAHFKLKGGGETSCP